LGWLLAIASFIIRYFGKYARESNLGTIATTPLGQRSVWSFLSPRNTHPDRTTEIIRLNHAAIEFAGAIQ
jgi:hypothetical protein